MSGRTLARNRNRASIVGVLILLSSAGISSAQDLGFNPVSPPWREQLPQRREVARILVGEREIEVELALTSEEQQLGLGYRDGLDPETGMLFVKERAAPASFWMKGMRFCLDIIWIEGANIVGAAETVCPDPQNTEDADRATFKSPIPVSFILEMPAGWLDDQGFGEGTPVRIPDGLSDLKS